jgi:hypothetical protein
MWHDRSRLMDRLQMLLVAFTVSLGLGLFAIVKGWLPWLSGRLGFAVYSGV